MLSGLWNARGHPVGGGGGGGSLCLRCVAPQSGELRAAHLHVWPNFPAAVQVRVILQSGLYLARYGCCYATLPAIPFPAAFLGGAQCAMTAGCCIVRRASLASDGHGTTRVFCDRVRTVYGWSLSWTGPAWSPSWSQTSKRAGRTSSLAVWAGPCRRVQAPPVPLDCATHCDAAQLVLAMKKAGSGIP